MDLRHTRVQLDEALYAAQEAAKRRPPRVKQAANQLFELGTEHGWDEAVLALSDAILVGAARHMDESVRAQRRGDNPRAGDEEQQANYLLGLYEQVYASYAVAVASKDTR